MVASGGLHSARRGALSQESFDALLVLLGPERDRAGERYEAVRARLLRFFTWRGAAAPEELTDETFDRVCRKVAEGEPIRPNDAERYFLGVARNVLREAWDLARRRGVREELNDATLAAQPSPPAAEEDPALTCLERCLGALPLETRALVLLYYEAEGGAKIDQRRSLASRMGIGVNALRIRLHRLRGRLESCVRTCVERGGAKGPSSAGHTEVEEAPE
jgi:DNA-directed RNA polymerase specialized sigma24 family protein